MVIKLEMDCSNLVSLVARVIITLACSSCSLRILWDYCWIWSRSQIQYGIIWIYRYKNSYCPPSFFTLLIFQPSSFDCFLELSIFTSIGMAKLLSPLGLFPSQNQRIRGLLEKCTLDHAARMENLHNELRERALSDVRWRQIQEDMDESVGVKFIVL